MPEHSEKNQSLPGIAEGRNKQKKHELYEIGQAKELLLIILNLCIIAAWALLDYLLCKAAVDRPLLEMVLTFGDGPMAPPVVQVLLLVIYLFFCLFWLLPKLEIKISDKVCLWIANSKIYIQKPEHTAVYAYSDITKIIFTYRSGYLRKIVIHTENSADTIFCRPRFSIPHSNCEGDIVGFTTELITVLHMYSKIQRSGKWHCREYIKL